MTEPRRDTRGILDPAGLLRRVRFRRHAPAGELQRWIEHYWFVDWQLDEPFTTQVIPHPCVNLAFQQQGTAAPSAVLTGPGTALFEKKLEGVGQVCGVQFRPGGFRPFAPGTPMAHWAGRSFPAAEALNAPTAPTAAEVLAPEDDAGRVLALDALLLAHSRREAPWPEAELALRLSRRVREDRTVLRVDELARAGGMSVRALQRLFHEWVGVSPKQMILRYRLHEALVAAEAEQEPDWAAIAATLGHADQAHLVREVTAAIGTSPAAYARAVRNGS